ncbi:MAG: Ku protein [Candidatus Binatales bacterium]
MAARPTGSGNISFGLVSIPVRLFSATSAKSVSFNLLHAKDLSRIQQKIYCPVDDAIVDRSELVRGYEIEKGRYVTFTDEELKNLEARDDHAIEIIEFVPLSAVDPIYFEDAYYLGAEPGAGKAYRLLCDAMASSKRVALGKFTLRGKEHLILIRPYAKGLMLHTVYYADEVKPVEEVDRAANESVKEPELALAKRLIDELTHDKFNPAEYRDNYRDRVVEAAEQKAAGQQVSGAPAEPRRGQVIDLMAALKASLSKRGVAAPESEQAEQASEREAGAKSHARSARSSGERRRAGGKK